MEDKGEIENKPEVIKEIILDEKTTPIKIIETPYFNLKAPANFNLFPLLEQFLKPFFKSVARLNLFIFGGAVTFIILIIAKVMSIPQSSYLYVSDLLEKILSLGLSIIPNVFGFSLTAYIFSLTFKSKNIRLKTIYEMSYTLLSMLITILLLVIISIIKYFNFNPNYMIGFYTNKITLIFLICACIIPFMLMIDTIVGFLGYIVYQYQDDNINEALEIKDKNENKMI